MIFQAVRPSLGFMGKYWNEGELTPDIIDEEMLKDPALKAHFKPVGGQKVAVNQEEKGNGAISFSELTYAEWEKKTVAELRLIAEDAGIELPEKITKAELINLIKQDK